MKKEILLIFICLTIYNIAVSQVTPDIKDTTDTGRNVATEVDAIVINSIQEAQDERESDESGSSNYVPGLLHSSRDVYAGNSSYAFSIAYFKNRGLDNKYEEISMNGFLMNNLVTGRANYSQWGGLNHVVLYPETIFGLNAVNFTFGDIGGATNYIMRASSYRQQIRATYSLSNRSYNNRLMFTGSTGLLKNGWAFAASVSARFGNALTYVDGTSYDGYSYFVSAEKQFNKEHALTLTAFAAPTVRGMQGNSVSEVYDMLDDHYYNPNWGWYQGKKRNARMRSTHEPVIMLSHYYTPKSNKFLITTTITSTFGKNSTTSLNWFDVPDPRPDYYRYLPSYQDTTTEQGRAMAAYTRDQWLNNADVRQIDWDNMYKVNQLATQQGKQAQYMVENRVIDHILIGGSSNIVATLTDHIKLAAGVDIRGMKQRNYKTINDLLGGTYWLDVDKYSEGDFPEDANIIYNNLDEKDKQLSEGDIFGYNYNYYIYKQRLWAMFTFTYNKVDFHAGAEVGGTEYWREGKMRNGRFANESKGKSDVKTFLDAAAKLGVTYKITGRNYLTLNGAITQSAPGILNAFLAPRIRNTYVSNLKPEKALSGELSYIMKYPKVQLRITGYYAYIKDITKLISFYHDDYASMVNYSMSGIDQRHAGVEAGAEFKIGSMFAIVVAGNYGDYRYASRPKVVINAENGYDIPDVEQTVYWKNYHVSGTPQAAVTLGLKFNHNYWYVNINANYFNKIYCDLNPERRTSNARGTLDVNSELYHLIADQTVLSPKGEFTLDASVSKSWRIKRYTIGFNASVTNILNNKNLTTTAWEQYRFDYNEMNVNKFQNKYYYALGTTFYLGLSFSFN
ncbi:MAG: TonB-dependent receptor [Bacteroidales bacterium]|jgi:hypothetical protein|nr:TonB-dependent receptor [Bacteroidales bacterium]